MDHVTLNSGVSGATENSALSLGLQEQMSIDMFWFVEQFMPVEQIVQDEFHTTVYFQCILKYALYGCFT